MTDAPVLLDVDGGIARITLNRPDRLNAFDEPMAHEWARVTAEVTERDDVAAIVLTGAGRAFCAGGDVRAMASELSGGSQVRELAVVINRGIRSLTDSAIPVVAAAHGTTVGGGLGILLCSDWAVVDEGARIGCRYADIGLTPDLSVSAQLAAAVGQRRALQLALSDRLLTANEALEWGLVADVVEPDRVLARAEEVARGWADGAARAYGEAKRLIRSRPERTFAAQLDEEARTIGEAFERAEAQERIAAFAARSSR